MMNARAVTETMNIQWRQQKFTYWRKSNVRSGGSVSTLVGTLNATFIGSDPRYPLRQIFDRAMGIAAGDDSKAPAPPSNSRKSICSKMACRVVEGRRFGLGLNALGHLPQQVVAIVDVADAVQPPQLEWAPSQTAQERIDPRHEFGPRPWGLMLTHAHSPWSPLCEKAHQNRSGGYAAGRSTERWSVTGTAVPIIVSRTRTRPAASSRWSVPTKSANGPDRIRTVCPMARPASKSARPASSVRATRASTTPLGTGTGRSSQVNREETPTVLRTDSQRSRPRSRMMKT